MQRRGQEGCTSGMPPVPFTSGKEKGFRCVIKHCLAKFRKQFKANIMRLTESVTAECYLSCKNRKWRKE